MRILFVTPPPYLPNRLHRIRAFDFIRILAKKHEVHLLSVTTEKKESKEFEEIKKLCKSVNVIRMNILSSLFNCLRFPFLPYEVAYCYSAKVKKEIKKIMDKKNVDIVYFKRLRSAIYLSNDRKYVNIPVILDTTDAMSMFYFRLHKRATFAKKLFYLLEAIKYKWFEKKMMKKIKNWIVCSEIDKGYLEKIEANIKIHVISNPVDTNYFSPQRNSPTSKESRSLPLHLRGVGNFSPSRWPKDSSKVEWRGGHGNSLLFRGLMNKPVNIDAICFFMEKIFPIVEKKIKNLKLYIVGPKPHRSIKKYNNGKNIFVTGYVEDIRKYITETDLTICPVRIASGTRYKVTQAWSMGRPVVSTTIGAEGLLYKKDKNIAIADSPKEFAKQIINLLKNKMLYDTLAKNGRKTVVAEYSFKAIAQVLHFVILSVSEESLADAR